MIDGEKLSGSANRATQSNFADLDERTDFIKKSLHLVNYVLARLVDTSLAGKGILDFDDLYSSGVIGLIEAADSFDVTREVKFSTFAVPRIRGAILDAVRGADPVSRTIRRRGKQIQKAFVELEQEFQEPATDEEVARKAGMTVEEMQQTLQVIASIPSISLDDQIAGDDESMMTFGDSVGDLTAEDPRDTIHKAEIKERLVEVIKEFADRDRGLMAMYYFEEMTFKEIGLALGVTESRVCQMHTRILMRLKAKLQQFEIP